MLIHTCCLLGSRGWRRKIRCNGRIYFRLSGRNHDILRLKSSLIPHMRSIEAWGSLRSELRTCRNLRRIWSRAAKLTIRDRFRSIGVNTFLLCGFSEQSETMGGCLNRRGFASHIHIVDSYLHHGAHAGCSDSEEVPATYIYIRRRCRDNRSTFPLCSPARKSHEAVIGLADWPKLSRTASFAARPMSAVFFSDFGEFGAARKS